MDDVVELDKASVWNLEQGVSSLMEKMDFSRAISWKLRENKLLRN